MKFSVLAVLILVGFGSACSDSTVGNVAVDEGGVPNPQGLNASLSGKIIGTDRFDDFQPVSIDLSTGQRTVLPLTAVQNLVSSTQSFDLASSFSLLTPGGFTSTAPYLQLFPLCNDRSVNEFDDGCWSFYDSSFVSEGAGVISGVEAVGVPKLSPSGRRFVTVEFDPLSNDQSYMTIFSTLNGAAELSLSLPIDNTFGANRSGAPAIEWGPSDELFYSNPATNPPVIFVTEPGKSDLARSINLPTQYSGIIEDMQISPDGKKLLLDYERHGFTNGSFPMILDLETLALTKPAVTETDVDMVPLGDGQSGSDMGIRGWSQDSEWIFVTYRNFNTTPTIGQTINGDNQPVSFFVSGAWHLSAVPASALAAVLSPDVSIATQGVISPIRYLDDNDAVVAVWGSDRYSPIGVD